MKEKNANKIVLMSFGFKYGLPKDANYVFDLRFIPNPYYVPSLRAMSGRDIEIQDYLLSHGETRELLARCASFLEYIFAASERDMTVAFGCTGGRHRSVAFAEWLYSHFEADPRVACVHRDILKDEENRDD